MVPALVRHFRRSPPSLAVSVVAVIFLVSGCSVLGLDDEAEFQYLMAQAPQVVPRTSSSGQIDLMLHTAVAVRNASEETVELGYGVCALQLQLFSPEGPPVEPVWGSSGRRSWPNAIPIGCPLGAFSRTLEPGDTARIAISVELVTILADSLDTGEYLVRGILETSAGAVRLPLGTVHLPETTHPLPAGEYRRAGIRYRVGVSADTSRPGHFTAVLEAELAEPDSRSRTRRINADCAFELLAHGSARERETVPVPPTAWELPRKECGDETIRVDFVPGLTRRFPISFSGRELVSWSSPAGRYFLTAIVHAGRRPIRMAAGQVDIP